MRFTLRCSPCLTGLVVLSVLSTTAYAGQHQVTKGESLWTIAAKYHMTVHALCQANKLDEEAILQPGQKLRVPTTAVVKRAKTPPKGYLTAPETTVNTGPGTDYERTALGYKGACVELLGKCHGWFLVRFRNGTKGWVPWQSVKTEQGESVKRVPPPPTPQASSGKSKSTPSPSAVPVGTLRSEVTLHCGPGVEYPECGAAVAGARCRLLGKANGWFKVEVGKSGGGWVPVEQVNTDSASGCTAEANAISGVVPRFNSRGYLTKKAAVNGPNNTINNNDPIIGIKIYF